MKSIDFDRVARFYDAFVRADFDLAFWTDEVARHPGRCAELMCGTGRISLPILRTGRPLTCVDYSAGLLEVLRAKVERERLPATLLPMDVRELALPDPVDFAFIGFHSFSELLTDDDALAALRAIRRNLAPGGSFLCSLHAPAARRPALQGQWQDLGTSPLGAGTLEVRVRFQVDEGDRVEGVEVFRERDASGAVVDEVELPARFRLLEGPHLERLAREAGMAATCLFGDYQRGPPGPHSPFLVYELR